MLDTARDILVGKVPQITIALIYKFKDDIIHNSTRYQEP